MLHQNPRGGKRTKSQHLQGLPISATKVKRAQPRHAPQKRKRFAWHEQNHAPVALYLRSCLGAAKNSQCVVINIAKIESVLPKG